MALCVRVRAPRVRVSSGVTVHATWRYSIPYRVVIPRSSRTHLATPTRNGLKPCPHTEPEYKTIKHQIVLRSHLRGDRVRGAVTVTTGGPVAVRRPAERRSPDALAAPGDSRHKHAAGVSLLRPAGVSGVCVSVGPFQQLHSALRANNAGHNAYTLLHCHCLTQRQHSSGAEQTYAAARAPPAA